MAHGPHPKSKKELCAEIRHGPVLLPPRLKRKDNQPLIDAGWLRQLERGEVEFGPSCGLILSIVARRESLECAVVRPDGRMIPRDEGSQQFESTDVMFMPRNPKPKGGYPGITPAGFITELAAVIGECLDHRSSISSTGFAAVCIAWPGRIDRYARPAADGQALGNVDDYEQKASGGWTVDGKPVSLAELVEEGLERAGFQKLPPVLVINDADAELLAMANIPLEERSPTKEELAESSGLAVRAKEIFERTTNARVALSITVAGGVGGALLVDGSLVRGQRGFVGELGEVPIDIGNPHLEKGRVTITSLEELLGKRSFPRWKYAHKHALDYWASGRSIVDQLCLAEDLQDSKYKRKRTYTDELGIASDHGNMEVATAILKRAGRLIGLGIIGPVLMLDPAVILVSSPLPSKPLADGIKELLNDEIGDVNEQDIVLAVDCDSTRQLKGAARWAIQEIVDPALSEVCEAKNKTLEKLDVLKLAAWPVASAS